MALVIIGYLMMMGEVLVYIIRGLKRKNYTMIGEFWFLASLIHVFVGLIIWAMAY